MKKRILALLLAAVMVMAAIPAAFAAEPVLSGKCGDNLTWTADPAAKTLTISGTGPMYDYGHFDDEGNYIECPWRDLFWSVYDTVVIKSGVTSIGDDAFNRCTNLTSVTIPAGVTSIGENAFGWCSGLTSVVIPDSAASIGGAAFYQCSSLTSVTIPNSVTFIGENAFDGCSGLTSVIIPGSVTFIGKGAFSYCTSLTSITIPDSVTSIGEQTFFACGLTSVTIPDSVTTIDREAFFACSGLTDVYYNGSQAQWGKIICNYYDYETYSDKQLSFADGGQEKASLDSVTVHYAVADPSFPDVPAGTWYTDAVKYAADNGLMKGDENGRFNPTDTITRAEAAQILYNRADTPGAGSAVFSDVAKTDWFYNAVTWAADQGLVHGSGGAFMPSDTTTREQLAVMLYNAANKPATDPAALNARPDGSKVSDWARVQMAWAVESGIINGDTSGNLNPQRTAIRAEVATMVQRFCEKYGI